MDLSIIIVNKDSGDMLHKCLASVLNGLEQLIYEIIVIDNASTDDSLEKIRDLARSRNIKIINNKENTGFAAGNNQGIRAATGRIILLINHDIIVKADTIRRSFTFINGDNNIGVLGCRLINKDGSWQRSYGYCPTLWREFFEIFFPRSILRCDILPMVHGYREYPAAYEVDWISGAFFMVRKDILDAVGYLDERFFMYFEDIDLCKRIKGAGKKIYYYPPAESSHIHTKDNISSYRLVDNGLSPYIFFSKHYGRLSVFILWVMTIIKTSFRTAIFFTGSLFIFNRDFRRKGRVNWNTLLFNLRLIYSHKL